MNVTVATGSPVLVMERSLLSFVPPTTGVQSVCRTYRKTSNSSQGYDKNKAL